MHGTVPHVIHIIIEMLQVDIQIVWHHPYTWTNQSDRYIWLQWSDCCNTLHILNLLQSSALHYVFSKEIENRIIIPKILMAGSPCKQGYDEWQTQLLVMGCCASGFQIELFERSLNLFFWKIQKMKSIVFILLSLLLQEPIFS